MNENFTAASIIGHFALACEQLNAYAQTLREKAIFQVVRTGADIRRYESAACLEKWIEAELDKSEGISAAWWLEIKYDGNRWIIESSVNISPNIWFLELETKYANSIEDLNRNLRLAVDGLICAMANNDDFSIQVKKHLKTN